MTDRRYDALFLCTGNSVNLPIKSLDGMTLDSRLHEIGRMKGASPLASKEV